MSDPAILGPSSDNSTGNGLNVVKVMPESAIKFGAYESAKQAFARLEGHNDPKRLLPVSQFLSGGIGGMVAQCFVYPLDTLKLWVDHPSGSKTTANIIQ